MKRTHRHLVTAGLTALGLSFAHAGMPAADAGLSRTAVRAALDEARASNTLTPSGEIGDTTQVLAAREAFNARQSQTMLARQDKARQAAEARLALDELVAELQAKDTVSDELLALTEIDT